MIPKDKKLHLAAGAAAGLVGAGAMYAVFPNFVAMWLAGSLLAAVAGWLKEDYDRDHPDKHTYDPADARYTLYGGIASAFLVALILSSAG